MRTFTLFFFLFSTLFLWGQDKLSGTWEGVITQDEGGVQSEYKMILKLSIEGKKIKGRSFVYFGDKSAEMEIDGELLDKNKFIYKEINFIRFDSLPKMEWCLKVVVLDFKRTGSVEMIEGKWGGKTSFSDCVPGRVRLRRIKGRV